LSRSELLVEESNWRKPSNMSQVI